MRRKVLHASMPANHPVRFCLAMPDLMTLAELVDFHQFIALAKDCGAVGFYVTEEK